jgi:hypothetical protein
VCDRLINTKEVSTYRRGWSWTIRYHSAIGQPTQRRSEPPRRGTSRLRCDRPTNPREISTSPRSETSATRLVRSASQPKGDQHSGPSRYLAGRFLCDRLANPREVNTDNTVIMQRTASACDRPTNPREISTRSRRGWTTARQGCDRLANLKEVSTQFRGDRDWLD